VISLTRTHPKERVDWACGVALQNRAFRTGPYAAWPSMRPRVRARANTNCSRNTKSSAISASTPAGLTTKEEPRERRADTKLRHLRLSGFVQALPIRNQQAVHNNLAHVESLELLVEDELTRRRDRFHARRLKQAQILQVKTLDSFDWSFNPKIPKQLVPDLSTVRFVGEHGGVLLIGPSGTGKSHVSVSLACRAIEAGYPCCIAPPSTLPRTSLKPTRPARARISCNA
jgi:IstB-like ATP binding protein